MRILFADTFPVPQIERLQARGYTCEQRGDLTADTLADAIAGFDVLVVRSTPVDRLALEASDLHLVIRAGAGYNTIDVAAASDRGVYVSNVPGKNAVAVAELAFGLLLSIDRRIPDNVADLRAGRWNKALYQRAPGLLGQRVGIVGLGAVGLEFAERANAFGMHVHALAKHDRPEATQARLEALGAIYHDDLPTLAAACDVLSLHVPATPETEGLLNAELLAQVRPGSVILNTSRGNVVDETALLAAIDEKDLRVGLDVYRNEPGTGKGDFASALAQHPNVYGTHHIGASTDQAQRAIADEVVSMLVAFAAGQVRNAVNLDPLRGTSTLVVRHDNRVGVLAAVLKALRGAGINVEQMENRIFSGGRAAAATIQISGSIDAALASEIEAHEQVIGIAIEQRP
jgi:D-3-phosphoglycerate dehydrogenase